MLYNGINFTFTINNLPDLFLSTYENCSDVYLKNDAGKLFPMKYKILNGVHLWIDADAEFDYNEQEDLVIKSASYVFPVDDIKDLEILEVDSGAMIFRADKETTFEYYNK